MQDRSDSTSIRPRGELDDLVRPPGSKSITNRALVVASLARGTSTLVGALESDDTAVMRSCLRALGVEVVEAGEEWTVYRRGGVLAAPVGRLDVGASGTTARFLTAAASLADGAVELDGTPRMRERPIGDLVDALAALGPRVEYLGRPGCLPLRVWPAPLRGGRIEMEAGTSSQFVSAVAMVAPLADTPVEVRFREGRVVSRPYLETTIEVMGAFGVKARLAEDGMRVPAPAAYQAARLVVEADASAAVYPWCAAAIAGGRVAVAGIGRTSTQADLAALDVLRAMGCSVESSPSGIAVSRPPEATLRGVDVDLSDAPDAVVALAVVAAFAETPTRIRNVANLRLKETDRLRAVATELTRLGASVRTGEDWLAIEPATVRPAVIETYDDHRMAMAFSLAGLRVPGVRILDPGCVAKTWPGFFAMLEALGGGRPTTEAQTRAEPEDGRLLVAVDGPGGAGKSTVSRRVGEALDLPHLDTGAFYRAAALAVLRTGVDVGDQTTVAAVVARSRIRFEGGATFLDGRDVSEDIRLPEIGSVVSVVASHADVRDVMVGLQRAWVDERGGSAVVEGRDIGTVVFPDATVKVFLTARPEVRAARRAGDLVGHATPETVAEGLARRDRLDSTRDVSPLVPADDAVVVDTSDLDIEEVVAEIVALARSRS